MSLSPMSDDLNIIAGLADKPNATDGLSAAQLKAKFDEGPGLIKTYINATLVPAIDEEIDVVQLGPAKRQPVINGNFAVNQRVKSGTVAMTAGQYGHDRWKAGASGCTYTFATSENVTTLTITAGSLIQVVEGNNLYSGTYTLSWTGTAQGKIGSGSYGASGITGTIVGGTNINIEFNTGTLSNVQLNAGSIALPYQPRSFPEELILCLRYYEKSFSYATMPAHGTGSVGVHFLRTSATDVYQSMPRVRYAVDKRIIPTIAYYNPLNTSPGTSYIRNYTSNVDLPALTGEPNEKSFRVYVNNTSVAGQQDLAVHWVADAEL